MNKLKKTFAVLAFVAIGTGSACAQTGSAPPPPPPVARTPPPPPVKPSAVKFKELIYNFGRVAYNSNISHVFEFTNVSSDPVVVKDVGTSCGCTTPGWSKEPVGPGKTGSVSAKYDSSRIGAFTKTLTVYFNGETIKLTITGTVLPPKSENSTPQPHK